MATTLTMNSIGARFGWEFSNSLPWGAVSNSHSFNYSVRLTDGTAANNANRLYVTETTLAASTNVDFDLAGTLLDLFGNTITFVKVKFIYVELLTTTTASAIAVGGHGSAAFATWLGDASDTVKVLNGGCLFLGAPGNVGYAVTATTADILRLTNLDGSNVATYRLGIAGTSA